MNEMTAPLRTITLWSHLDRKASARFRKLEQTRESRMAGVMQCAEQINEAWRNRTPEQIAAYEAHKLISSKSDQQFDVEGEAADQGMSVPHYVRASI